MPRLLLVGRDSRSPRGRRARPQSSRTGAPTSTPRLSDPEYAIFFDAAATQQRFACWNRRSPPASTSIPRSRWRRPPRRRTPCWGGAARGLKHGVVEDKVHLPGMRKLAAAHGQRRARSHRRLPARIRLVGLRRHRPALPAAELELSRRRRRADPRYVSALALHHRVDRGPIVRVASSAWIATPERIDEEGARYPSRSRIRLRPWSRPRAACSAPFSSSWATRVRRDDLLTLQVDGTEGSAVAGLHRCHVQSTTLTPAIAHFSVMKDIGADYRGGWTEAPPLTSYCNPYRVGWEHFLRHVATTRRCNRISRPAFATSPSRKPVIAA